jgi:hypothetical protein
MLRRGRAALLLTRRTGLQPASEFRASGTGNHCRAETLLQSGLTSDGCRGSPIFLRRLGGPVVA